MSNYIPPKALKDLQEAIAKAEAERYTTVGQVAHLRQLLKRLEALEQREFIANIPF